MKSRIHLISSVIATLCIFTFFTSTLIVEISGAIDWIKIVKSLIVFPGLFILVPSIAITGATGFAISKDRGGRLIKNKKKRMPFVAANGLIILLPAAIYLDYLAASESFGTRFYLVQALELLAGGANLFLMIINIRDGFALTGRLSLFKT